MKVLMVATGIYDSNDPELVSNKSGIAMMVNDIFCGVSKLTDVILYTTHFYHGKNKKIIAHSIIDDIQYAKLCDIVQGVRWFFKFKQPFLKRIRYMFYAVDKGYLRHTLKEQKPDLVHIHGMSYVRLAYIEVCEELGIPYVVTLHGVVGFDDTVLAEKWEKKLEKDFLIRADKLNIPVTVVSSGVKNRIEKNYLGKKANNISVITNGTDIYTESKVYKREFDLRKEFNLPNEGKICTVIGSLCDRKNQIQVVEACKTLIENGHNDVFVFMCGRDTLDGKIQKKIQAGGLENRVFVLGFLERAVISDILEQADLNIVASRDEGFGLSIIEAYAHGVPTVTFNDIDAVEGLYNVNTMVLCEDRSTNSLCSGILEGLSKTWDRTFIKKYAENFSMERMNENYKKEYDKILLTYAVHQELR